MPAISALPWPRCGSGERHRGGRAEMRSRAPASPLEVLAVGHSNRPLDEFLRLIDEVSHLDGFAASRNNTLIFMGHSSAACHPVRSEKPKSLMLNPLGLFRRRGIRRACLT